MALGLIVYRLGGDLMSSKFIYAQFTLGIVIGSIIACSPTKFGKNQQQATALCDSSVSNCVIQSASTEVTQTYKVGSGKVDILFVNDNSASMSKNQVHMAAKFAGFIQSLDAKSIDYRIAITTTDLNTVSQASTRLITFGNGQKFITQTDSSRVTLFNNAIIRNETLDCENLIISMFNTYGSSFQSNSYYTSQYPIKCPSSDTRGIYTANLVVSENTSSLMRTDANLNVILISNDNVRQGKAMELNDSAASFTSMMQQQHPTKYWDFNSIIVKDSTCKQSQSLYNAANQLVVNQSGPAIVGGIGIEYANLSNSAARDIDNNPRPRGQILDICQADYTHNFNSMSTQIADEARMFTMKCTPSAAPTVTVVGSSTTNISHTWNGDKVVFPRGTEGTSVTIKYNCYTGPT